MSSEAAALSPACHAAAASARRPSMALPDALQGKPGALTALGPQRRPAAARRAVIRKSDIRVRLEQGVECFARCR